MANERSDVRALLLDLDGVLRRWSPEIDARAERLAGLPVDAIRRVAFASDLLLPTITGAVSDEEWRRRIAERLRAEYPDAPVERAVEAWSASPGEVDPDVLDLVRRVRRRATVVLLTNASSRLDRDLARLGLAGEFDRVVNSSAVGWVKPQPEIFDHALRTAGVPAAQALFVDDNPDFVAEASRLGLLTHHYHGLAALAAELARHGLIS